MIALVAIIFIMIQWRRVRQSKSQIKYLEKQAENKKIEIVEKDLEQKRIIFGLPETEQEQLAKIISNTGKMLRKVGFLQTELNKQITRVGPSKEYKKLQKNLEKIEEKKLKKRVKRKVKAKQKGENSL